MKTLKLLSILSFIILASCSNDDDNQPDNRQTYLVSEIAANGTFEYIYDDQNRLAEISFTHIADSNNNYTTIIESYDAENKAISIFFEHADDNNQREIYYYLPNGKIDKIEVYSVDGFGNSNHYIDLLYDYSGNVINQNLYDVATDFEGLYNEITLNAGGNITISKAYNPYTGDLVFQNDFQTFDDKKHPYAMLPLGSTGNISINNVMTSTSSNFFTGSITNFQYTYEYNAQGYPTKKTQVSPTGSEITLYIYELR